MHINPYLIIILAALLGRWLLETAADLLNMRNVRETISNTCATTPASGSWKTD
jgi:hypothetical protein